MKYESLFLAVRSFGKGTLCADPAAVSLRAYELWEKAGRPAGDGSNFWHLAEKEVLDEAAEHIIKKVFSPAIQEAAASIQLEATDYTKQAAVEAGRVVQTAMARDQMVLPDGVRFHRRVNDIEYLIVEEAPKVRTILVDMGYNRDSIGQYGQEGRRGGNVITDHQKVRIALPYVVYGMRLSGGRMQNFEYWFRNSPLKTLNDPLCLSPLPNTEESGKPCVPWPTFTGSLSEQIKAAIAFYWSTEFNYKLHNFVSPDERVKSFQKWAEHSVENPLFAISVKWPGSNATVARMVPGLEESKESVGAAMQGESSKFVRAAARILQLELPKPPPPVETVKPVETKKELGGWSTVTWS